MRTREPKYDIWTLFSWLSGHVITHFMAGIYSALLMSVIVLARLDGVWLISIRSVSGLRLRLVLTCKCVRSSACNLLCSTPYFFLVRVSSIPTSSPRGGALTMFPERACWVRSCKNASYYELFTGFSPCEQSSIYGLRILSCHGRQDNFPNRTLIFARLSNEISPRHRVNQCLLEWMLEAGRGRATSGSTMNSTRGFSGRAT